MQVIRLAQNHRSFFVRRRCEYSSLRTKFSTQDFRFGLLLPSLFHPTSLGLAGTFWKRETALAV
jgi:hypothetical protein